MTGGGHRRSLQLLDPLLLERGDGLFGPLHVLGEHRFDPLERALLLVRWFASRGEHLVAHHCGRRDPTFHSFCVPKPDVVLRAKRQVRDEAFGRLDFRVPATRDGIIPGVGLLSPCSPRPVMAVPRVLGPGAWRLVGGAGVVLLPRSRPARKAGP